MSNRNIKIWNDSAIRSLLNWTIRIGWIESFQLKMNKEVDCQWNRIDLGSVGRRSYCDCVVCRRVPLILASSNGESQSSKLTSKLTPTWTRHFRSTKFFFSFWAVSFISIALQSWPLFTTKRKERKKERMREWNQFIKANLEWNELFAAVDGQSIDVWTVTTLSPSRRVLFHLLLQFRFQFQFHSIIHDSIQFNSS